MLLSWLCKQIHLIDLNELAIQTNCWESINLKQFRPQFIEYDKHINAEHSYLKHSMQTIILTSKNISKVRLTASNAFSKMSIVDQPVQLKDFLIHIYNTETTCCVANR